MGYMRTPFRWWTGLSPRRRILLGALALAVAACRGRRGAGSGGPPEPVPGRPGTVLLVPGYGGSTTSLDELAARIRSTGRTATVVPLAGDGTGDLTVQARVLNGYVNPAIGAGSGPVTVIGYSAGGVVAWLWDVDYGGAGPDGQDHHPWIAAARRAHRRRGHRVRPGGCPVACQQLVPGSALLTRLQQSAAAAAALAVAVERRRPDRAAAGFRPAARRGERPASVRLPGRGHPARPAARRPARRRPRAARAGRRPRHRPGSRRLRGHAVPGLPGAGRPPRRRVQAVMSLVAKFAQAAAEEHHHVHRLDGEPAFDVPPEDRLAEEVDPRQPVPGRQVRLHGGRGVQRDQDLAADQRGQRPRARRRARSRSAWTGTARSRRRRASRR